MKVSYRILLLAGVATAQETMAPSDMPSDVPSYVPTPKPSSSPSSLPTIPGNGMGPYPPCPICPEGQEIEFPNNIITGTEFTCFQANQAGVSGNIEEENCALLQGGGPAICGCREMSGPDSARPTMSPVQNIVPPPTEGECTTSTCSDVTTWGALGEFVQAAASGDTLCMCGHVFSGSMCGGTIAMNEEKDITLECPANNICSYECPDTAFIVDAGSLTLTGSEENFVFTGGARKSRIVVGDQGTLMASQVVFEDTQTGDASADSRKARNLQMSDNYGGGVETYGTTTIANSRFEKCSATLEGGGVYVGAGSATFTAVTFRENEAFSGGAIFAKSGSLVVTDSVFEGNGASNGPDLFNTPEADVQVCGNTAESDVLTGCSGAGTLFTATSMALAIGLAMALFA